MQTAALQTPLSSLESATRHSRLDSAELDRLEYGWRYGGAVLPNVRQQAGGATRGRTWTRSGSQRVHKVTTAAWPARVFLISRSCDAIAYNNPVPVAMALVEKKGRILMTRNLEWPEGMLGFVAGFLERDDGSPVAGMCRELQEEVGLAIEPSRLTLVGVSIVPRMNQLVVLYHVELREDEEPVRNADELAEMKWVPLSKVKLTWTEGPGPQIKAFLTGRMKSKL